MLEIIFPSIPILYLVFLAWAYYGDYQRDKKEFMNTIKIVPVLLFVIVLATWGIYSFIFWVCNWYVPEGPSVYSLWNF